jgi:hypothetical protein
MVSAANIGMITPERDRDPEAAINAASGHGDSIVSRRDSTDEGDAQRGAARRSFARRIDCSGWDAERGAQRPGQRPPPRTPNGRNHGGGGRAA